MRDGYVRDDCLMYECTGAVRTVFMFLLQRSFCLRCVVHAITMRADCRGAKAQVQCVACVNAHTQEKMDVCACNMCVQAIENVHVDFVLF